MGNLSDTPFNHLTSFFLLLSLGARVSVAPSPFPGLRGGEAFFIRASEYNLRFVDMSLGVYLGCAPSQASKLSCETFSALLRNCPARVFSSLGNGSSAPPARNLIIFAFHYAFLSRCDDVLPGASNDLT